MPHELTECPFYPGYGHPRHWKPASEKYGDFFVLANLTLAASDSMGPAAQQAGKLREGFDLALLDLGGLTATAVGELMCFVANGMGVGALKVSRTLMDYAINAAYLVKHPGERENYLGWHAVEQMRLLEYEREHGIAEKLAPEELQRVEREYSRVKHLYLNAKGKRRAEWSRIGGLRRRANDIGIEETYALFYTWTSELIHGTVGGLAFQLDAAGGKRYDFPPSFAHCDLAIKMGLFFGLMVLTGESQHFHVDSVPPNKMLWEEFNRALGVEGLPTNFLRPPAD